MFKNGKNAQNTIIEITYFSLTNFANEARQAISYLNIDIKDGIIELDRKKMTNACTRRLQVVNDLLSDYISFQYHSLKISHQQIVLHALNQ